MPSTRATLATTIFARRRRTEARTAAAAAAKKTGLESDPKAQLHIKASVKVLQVWLNSPDVAGPIVYTAKPVAAAFGVAPVAGVPDEARSGVGALIARVWGEPVVAFGDDASD